MENLELLIKELVKQPNETGWLEFKENYKDSQMIGEDICVLANAAALAGNLLNEGNAELFEQKLR